ncbi:MAG: serine hydrolase domain-containing protein [Gemmatimonadaceae bacterium]
MLRFTATITFALAASTVTQAPNRDPVQAPDCDPALHDRLEQKITPILSDHAASSTFSGVVLVACKGKAVYSAAYGEANRARHEKNTLQTHFNLGSMNKMWTAVAIGQLVEQGKIDVNAPVGRYLPDFPNKDVRENVLVRHLLTHTSGLNMYFKRGYLRDHVIIKKAADLARFYAEDSLDFRPGDRFQYSNSGFATLGMIVECVSGMNYFDYVRKNVLERAGMSGATFLHGSLPNRAYAMGYAKPPGATDVVENTEFIEHSTPAGGAYSDAASIVAFSRALWGGKLLSPSTVKEFTDGKVDMVPGIKYAYGFGDRMVNGWRSVGHNGGGPGIAAEFVSFPDHDVDVVVLTNIDAPEASQVLAAVNAVITNGPMPTFRAAGADGGGGGPRMLIGGPPGGGTQSGAPGLPALDPNKLPDLPIGRRAQAFFDAFSEGGATYEKFIAEQMVQTEKSPAERAQTGAGMRERTGRLKFKRILLATPTQLVMVVETEKGGDLKVTLQIEADPPNRILPGIEINPYP